MISYYRKKLITPDLCHLCCCCLLWPALILLANEGIHNKESTSHLEGIDDESPNTLP
jgi:hypothetical protein